MFVITEGHTTKVQDITGNIRPQIICIISCGYDVLNAREPTGLINLFL